MARWLNSADPEFEDGFKTLLAQKREQAADVNDSVAAIIARVREEGDAALAELTLRYDKLDLGKVGVKVTGAEITGGPGQGGQENARCARARPRSHPRPPQAAIAAGRRL